MSEQLAEGTVLASRYVVEELLGNGAMGAVYRARHVKVGRAFAVKVLHRTLTSNAKMLARFEREAELAGRLSHPHLVGVVDVGVLECDVHYLVMEFAPGETLAVLMDQAPMDEDRVIDLACQLCDGLQAAHDAGLVHRDFKPENVIVELEPSGREIARIVDFGVAILRDSAAAAADDDDRGRLTTKGVVIGTPHYMAPEQALGAPLDHRADLFALGLICYEMLTGKLPFEGDAVDIARANLLEPTTPMRKRVPTAIVDPVLEAIIGKLLEKDPANRPQNAVEAREVFELYRRDRLAAAKRIAFALPPPVPAPVPPPVDRSARELSTPDLIPIASHRSSWRRTAIAIGAVAIIGGGVAVASWIGTRATAMASAPELALPDAGLDDLGIAVRDHADHEAPVPTAAMPVDVPSAGPRPRLVIAEVPAPPPPVGLSTIDALDVAALYGAVGRELKALEKTKGDEATYDLWPRYRWIRINGWLGTQDLRTSVGTKLTELRRDVARRR